MDYLMHSLQNVTTMKDGLWTHHKHSGVSAAKLLTPTCFLAYLMNTVVMTQVMGDEHKEEFDKATYIAMIGKDLDLDTWLVNMASQ